MSKPTPTGGNALKTSGNTEIVPARPNTRTPPAAPEVLAAPPVKGWVVFGIAVVGVFFGGFGSWAAMAPLSKAAVAPGHVVVESSRQVVNHLEGGIIQDLEAREGETVEAGQVLLTLAPVQAESKVEAVRRELINLRAAEARLQAQLEGAAEPKFPSDLSASDEPETVSILQAQRGLFETAKLSIQGQLLVLEQRIQQLQSQIQGLDEQVRADAQQLSLLEQQRDAIAPLVDDGIIVRSQLLDVEGQIAGLRGQRGNGLASIERVRQQISETQMQMASLQDDTRDARAKELDEARSKLSELRQSLRSAEDVLDRQEVRAPVTGTIVDLRFHTKGGVVPPGQPILDIIPANDQMMIEARINPIDIDVVYPGLPVDVNLTAFSRRTTPTLPGELVTVSADLFNDERTGAPYYKGMIRIPDESFAALTEDIKLYPGMPADAMIKLGDRTFLEYMLEPLKHSLDRAFKET